MIDQNFPALITELETLGLRVEDIASKTGASAAAVYRWKRGSKPMMIYAERVEALLTRERRKARTIPKDFPVKVIQDQDQAIDRATCGSCGRSWDDGVITSMTPTPSGRCPFEAFHAGGD